MVFLYTSNIRCIIIFVFSYIERKTMKSNASSYIFIDIKPHKPYNDFHEVLSHT